LSNPYPTGLPIPETRNWGSYGYSRYRGQSYGRRYGQNRPAAGLVVLEQHVRSGSHCAEAVNWHWSFLTWSLPSFRHRPHLSKYPFIWAVPF